MWLKMAWAENVLGRKWPGRKWPRSKMADEDRKAVYLKWPIVIRYSKRNYIVTPRSALSSRSGASTQCRVVCSCKCGVPWAQRRVVCAWETYISVRSRCTLHTCVCAWYTHAHVAAIGTVKQFPMAQNCKTSSKRSGSFHTQCRGICAQSTWIVQFSHSHSCYESTHSLNVRLPIHSKKYM